MEDWLTAPVADKEDGTTTFVSVRPDVARWRDNPRYVYRLEIIWPYADAGMPTEAQGEEMGAITDALEASFHADPVAVIAGMYTGLGERRWIVYTASLQILQRKINEALAPLPLLPLRFEAYDDPGWEEYDTMRALVDEN